MNTEAVDLGTVADISQGLATSGHGAGAVTGDWALSTITSGNIEDDRLNLAGLGAIEIEQNARTERHLLRPYDILVTARSQSVKAALVPPSVTRTVAASTLLVVRARRPETGMAHFLWYFLTSAYGRSQIETRLTSGVTIASLSAKNLAEVPVSLPPERELHQLADLVEASEQAYTAGLEAVLLRRSTLRDCIISALRQRRQQ